MQVRACPIPEPGARDVRVRIQGTGICGSNLPVWEGRPWFRYPLEPGQPGHEGWGVVDAVGAQVRTPREGDHVAVLSSHALAEYDVTSAESAIPIPESLASQGFPGEALGCVMNIFARSGIVHGETVAIIGIGFLGACLTQLAVRRGARVIAVSRRDFAHHVARRMGADSTVHFDADAATRVAEACGECDVAIDAVGSQAALELAASVLREEGRLVIAGYHQDGARTVDMQTWNWRAFDIVNAHFRNSHVQRRGIADAVDAVTSGALDPSPLYTHRFPLAETADAFAALRTRPDGFLKALVCN